MNWPYEYRGTIAFLVFFSILLLILLSIGTYYFQGGLILGVIILALLICRRALRWGFRREM